MKAMLIDSKTGKEIKEIVLKQEEISCLGFCKYLKYDDTEYTIRAAGLLMKTYSPITSSESVLVLNVEVEK